MTTDLWRMSAVEIAAAIRCGQVCSREVIEAHLNRIEAVNPQINAVTVVRREPALAAAEAADRAVAAGADLPPLHGVPFTVKENIDLTGTATTQGAKVWAAAYPSADAPAVARLRAAGGIPIARTNCPAGAVRWHCDSELWGATVNPFDPSVTPGASSGGEAAALATGMTPLGLGTDGLGSLRWPAQCCGITALKPTLGRVPHATSVDPADAPIGPQLMIVVGPMARRVADLRVALELIAGSSWRDPWAVPAPLRGPELARPVRVALVTDPAGQGTDQRVKQGVIRAGQALEDAGYVVDAVEPPAIDLAAKVALAMLNTPDIRAAWQLLAPLVPAGTQRFLSAFYEVAGDADPVATLSSFATRQSLLRSWGEFQERHPLIVAPVFTGMPFAAGTDLDDGRVAETINGMRMAIAVNALGLPAVAVPVGIAAGLPLSAQIIGPRYREDLCLDAAAAVEQRLGVLTPIDPGLTPGRRHDQGRCRHGGTA
jgi:amidase